MRRLVFLLVLVAGVLPASAQAWSWPADGEVLRPFVFGDDPYAGGQHRGIDIAADLGSDVRAPVAGVVSFAGTVPKGGKTLSIRTTDGYTVVMQHLGSFAVRKGAAVGEGDAVAKAGTSGEADWPEPYVYLSVRRTADEQGYVDPLTLLPTRGAPDPSAPPDDGTAPDPAATPTPAPAPPAVVHPHPPATQPPPSAPVAPAQPPQPAQPAPVPAPSAVPAPAPDPAPSIPQPVPTPRTVPVGEPPGSTPVFVPAAPPAAATRTSPGLVHTHVAAAPNHVIDTVPGAAKGGPTRRELGSRGPGDRHSRWDDRTQSPLGSSCGGRRPAARRTTIPARIGPTGPTAA